MNIVSFHKRDLQLVIQYLSIARIKRLSEELRFFSANPTENLNHRRYSNIGHSSAIPHQKRLESCNLYCLLGYSCTSKGTIVCYLSPFTRGAMIVNKQECQAI